MQTGASLQSHVSDSSSRSRDEVDRTPLLRRDAAVPPVNFAIVSSKPLIGEPLLIDLLHSRSVIHSVGSQPCSVSDAECKCIHYGFCSPVQTTSGEVSQDQKSIRASKDSGLFKRQSNVAVGSDISSLNDDRVDDLSSRLHLSTAYDLIVGEDETCDLQSLLNEFICSEKMKQQTRQGVDGHLNMYHQPQFMNMRPVNSRLSQSLTNLSSPSPNDMYVRGRSSHSQKQLLENFKKLQQNSVHQGVKPLVTSNNSKSNTIQPQRLQTADFQLEKQSAGDIPSKGDKFDRRITNTGPEGKLIFGLSEKTNKNKYLQLANSRKAAGPVGAGRDESQNMQNSKRQSVGGNAVSANISTVNRTGCGFQSPFSNELLQLTDDEKVQYLLASHSAKQSDRSSKEDAEPGHQQTLSKANLKETSKNSLLQPRNNSQLATQKTNLLKYKSLSCDSLCGSKQLIDFNSYSGPQMINFESPFDYAKTRFINSFILSAKTPEPQQMIPSQNNVSETKNKLLEKSNSSSNSASKNSCDTVDDGKQNSYRRKSSPAEMFMKIPVRSPVKPYLSRGSVAERVLLFEKCPEMHTQRKSSLETSRKSKSSLMYRHWKTPATDAVSHDCNRSQPYLMSESALFTVRDNSSRENTFNERANRHDATTRGGILG